MQGHAIGGGFFFRRRVKRGSIVRKISFLNCIWKNAWKGGTWRELEACGRQELEEAGRQEMERIERQELERQEGANLVQLEAHSDLDWEGAG